VFEDKFGWLLDIELEILLDIEATVLLEDRFAVLLGGKAEEVVPLDVEEPKDKLDKEKVGGIVVEVLDELLESDEVNI
jgi:hypothetical protein